MKKLFCMLRFMRHIKVWKNYKIIDKVFEITPAKPLSDLDIKFLFLITLILIFHISCNVYNFQDGTIESGIKSQELLPIHHLDDSEFFPGDFVLPSGGGSFNP